MIQVITLTGKEAKLKGPLVKLSSFHDIESLDVFEINVIDLRDKEIWKNNGGTKSKINIIDDFISISAMIRNSNKSQIIIIFPQNSIFRYSYVFVGGTKGRDYAEYIELKNMLSTLTGEILCKLHFSLKDILLVYENTKTKIKNSEVKASFYFDKVQQARFTSEGSEKATVIDLEEIILSTLDVDGYEGLIAFLEELGFLKQKEEAPEWLSEIKMFDDEEMENHINECNKQIEEIYSQIDSAQDVLNKNNRLKSILYTNGDQLVEVVFEILEELLGCDLSGFVDVKDADFVCEVEGIVFVGEIKGVNHNVKNENVSQVELHLQKYLDENETMSTDDVKALLIMNHQKNKPVSMREPVKDTQINLAKRNGSLIIETNILLNLLEQYRSNQISRDDIINAFKNEIGLFGLKKN